MMGRVWHLLVLDYRAHWHSLRHDLGKELTVGLAAAALIAVFGYIFNDFFNVQLAALSTGLRLVLARIVSVSALIVAAFSSYKVVLDLLTAKSSTLAMARMLGESRTALRTYRALAISQSLLIRMGLAMALIATLVLPDQPLWPSIGHAALAGAIALAIAVYRGRRPQTSNPGRPALCQGRVRGGTTTTILARWRLQQYLLRAPAPAMLLGLAMALNLLSAYALARGLPEVTVVGPALGAAMLIAAILSLVLAEDLRHAWTERAMGVTHAQIVAAYRRLAITISAGLGLASIAILGIVTIAFGTSFDLATLELICKPAAVMLGPSYFLPSVLLALEARRPLLNAMAMIVISLFLATAIFAHWLGLLLPLLLAGAAAEQQQGRYYRA